MSSRSPHTHSNLVLRYVVLIFGSLELAACAKLCDDAELHLPSVDLASHVCTFGMSNLRERHEDPGRRCRFQMSSGSLQIPICRFRWRPASHWEQMHRVASQCQLKLAAVAELFIPHANSRLSFVQILDSFLSQIFCTCPSSVETQSQERRDFPTLSNVTWTHITTLS